MSKREHCDICDFSLGDQSVSICGKQPLPNPPAESPADDGGA